jgi:hypothetical protein
MFEREDVQGATDVDRSFRINSLSVRVLIIIPITFAISNGSISIDMLAVMNRRREMLSLHHRVSRLVSTPPSNILTFL